MGYGCCLLLAYSVYVRIGQVPNDLDKTAKAEWLEENNAGRPSGGKMGIKAGRAGRV